MRRGIVAAAAFLFLFLGFAGTASATHFRYGHITWQRAPGSNTVTFTVTQAYRWDFEADIQVPFYFGDGTYQNLIVTNTLRPALGSMGGTIVEVNTAEDYFVSRITVTHTYSTAGAFTAYINNCCRLHELVNAPDASYVVKTGVDLSGSSVGSPVSTVPIIVRVPRSTGFSMTLPVVGAGGAPVTCSLSSSADSGLPKQPGQTTATYQDPYLPGNGNSTAIGINAGCTFKWKTQTSAVVNGLYAVQVKLASGTSTSAIDFLIQVVDGANRPPTCTGLTGAQTLVAGQPFSTSFVGSDPDGGSIVVSHQGLPSGATLTPASGTSGTSPMNATFAWTPPLSTAGSAYGVTITYTDPLGLQGSCGFTLSVVNPDTDGDGVNDDVDNCPNTANADQLDFDGDHVGDACDPDIDGDGILNGSDDCSLVPNPDQADLDGDGQGDLCDSDVDGDLVPDASDNCPRQANADQANLDGDALGDACDPDDDNDGVLDAADNCPVVANADQANLDGDSQGDACDPDMDGDGVANTADNCARIFNDDQLDTEGDGIGDACDPDDDNDGVLDAADNCLLVANADQSNLDGDSLGDACDPDIDGDDVLNTEDNCPLNANADQADLDGSGGGDVCDPDDDGDLVDDVVDNCARIANADQANLDGDAFGDVCDPDIDGDAIANETDNCPRAANPDQADLDHDGAGDLCDTDLDGDGVANTADNCASVANADQADADTDGMGDVCDPDADNDGVANADDNCWLVKNADQANLDGDDKGDVCDPDIDGDGVANETDNCRLVANADQANLDGDALGDACDPDVDGDGVANTADNCVRVPNANQADLDHDGQGDVCDADIDGDGVLNTADQCPLETALKDADGNGCLDRAALLCGVVQASGLPQGITTSLCAKSNNAAASTGATAASILDAFINEVSAQRGKKIAFSLADMLIAYATNAKSNL